MVCKLEKHNKKWSFRYIDIDGKQRRHICQRPLYEDAKDEQIEFLSELKNQKSGGKDYSKLLWATFCENFMQYSHQEKKAPESDAANIRTFNKYIKIKYFKELTTEKLREFRRKREVSGVKKSTINREMNTFSSMFTYAKSEINENIKHQAKTIKKFTVKTIVKDRVLHPLEIQKLFCCLEENYKSDGVTSLRLTKEDKEKLTCILKLLLYEGLRLKEAVCAEWKQVIWEYAVFDAEPHKTSENDADSVKIPLNTKLSEFLTIERKKRPNDIYIVPNIQNEKRQSKQYGSALSHQISDLFKRLNINNATAHTCRHTFISHLSVAGIDKLDIMSFARIKDQKILKIYEHLRPDFQTNKIDKLPY
jgi:integrase